jgi:hypothetical protein
MTHPETSPRSSPGEMPPSDPLLMLLETLQRLDQRTESWASLPGQTERLQQELSGLRQELQQSRLALTSTEATGQARLQAEIERRLLDLGQQTCQALDDRLRPLQESLSPLLGQDGDSEWQRRWTEQTQLGQELLQRLTDLQSTTSRPSSGPSSSDLQMLAEILTQQQALHAQLQPLQPLMQELPKLAMSLSGMQLALTTLGLERLQGASPRPSALAPRASEELADEVRMLWKKQEEFVLRLQSQLQGELSGMPQLLRAQLGAEWTTRFDSMNKELPTIVGTAVRHAVQQTLGQSKLLKSPPAEPSAPVRTASMRGTVLLASLTSTGLTALLWSGLLGQLWARLTGWMGL